MHISPLNPRVQPPVRNAIIVSLLMILPCIAFSQTRYVETQLSFLPTDINNSGQVIGYNGTGSSGSSTSYIWSNGITTSLGNGVVTSINDNGIVAGIKDDTPTYWQNANSTSVGTAGSYSSVLINNSGTLAVNTSSGSYLQNIYSNSVVNLSSANFVDTVAYVTALNANGQYAGVQLHADSGTTIDGVFYAASRHAEGFMSQWLALGGVPGQGFVPTAMNGSGIAVGYGNDFFRSGWIFDGLSSTSLGEGNTPWDINDAGTIVGGGFKNFYATGGTANAFIVEDNLYYDLNSLIDQRDPGLGHVYSAFAVNDSGLIIGYDTANSSGVLLTPITAIPEPATYAAICGLATMGFALIRRRRVVV